MTGRAWGALRCTPGPSKVGVEGVPSRMEIGQRLHFELTYGLGCVIVFMEGHYLQAQHPGIVVSDGAPRRV